MQLSTSWSSNQLKFVTWNLKSMDFMEHFIHFATSNAMNLKASLLNSRFYFIFNQKMLFPPTDLRGKLIATIMMRTIL